MADRRYRDEYQPYRREEQYRDYAVRGSGEDLDSGRVQFGRRYRESDTYRHDNDRDPGSRGNYDRGSGDADFQGSRSQEHTSDLQFRGRGPRGYRRSDDRIREDVCDVLTDDANVDATEIEVVVKDGEVMLTGSVNSRDQKRRAEAIAERVSGVRDVQNSLRVTQAQH